MSAPDEREIADRFTDLWWHVGGRGGTWQTLNWLGVPIWKHPFDLMMFQEVIWETRPQLIVEAGTARGGSAYFYATLFDLIGEGRVLTTDIDEAPDLPEHPRILYRTMSSTSSEFVTEATELARGVERTMVVLDSDHRRDHVRAELDLLAPLVTRGCYLICEDGVVNGHPILPDWGDGPFEALEEFLERHRDFEPDTYRERLLSTWNPRGYLLRVR